MKSNDELNNDTISVIENLVFVYENLNILNNESIRERLDFAIKSIKNMEKEFAELKQAKSDGRIIPKEAHQPYFVKLDALEIFESWNEITGVFGVNTSRYHEIESLIEEVGAMAFGAGAIYQSEASAALSEMGERE
jgi:hypothetical protein|nr:MAG TPA: hypothetical protein [Caudoviricetes sp.]